MTYALECSGPGGTRSDAVTVNVTLPEPGILVADFDSGADGFSSTGRWARSAESAHGAGQAWSDSPGGNYQNSVVTTLWSPAFDLSRYAAVSASFWHRYELQPGRDFGSILVDGGPAITEIASFTGPSYGWIPASFDLSAFAGRKSVRIGFRVTTDTSVVADGWYVDDVVVTGEESGARFVPITPCRLLDTRATNGPYGGQSIPAATSWFFRAAGDCGVPGDARAVTVVVAVVNPAATGHATLFAADQPRPVASAINFPAGTTRASNSIVKLPLDGGGDFALHNGSPGPAHFIVDVSGYFE
jgi:hypothetical protein